IRLQNGSQTEIVSTRHFVNAAGPFVQNVAAMLELDLPVFHELHVKIAFRDPLKIIPREAPLLIWTDPAILPWSEEERDSLNQSEETRYLLKEFPSGVHARPEGGAGSDTVLILWTYDVKTVDPVFPFSVDPHYPEIALRGLSLMIPGLRAYFGRMTKPVVDGGYYTKTRENRPLIGPLPIEGAYIIGGLSGFGIMAACGAGELLAASIAGNDLPPHAAAFSLARYEDPEYRKLLGSWGETGQL
ncbi:MAG: putative oxidoreductase, partial [Deltaproteobacteria bacterium]|nr:putative oxidoreductase [Deltaproteobacteria bacterium]